MNTKKDHSKKSVLRRTYLDKRKAVSELELININDKILDLIKSKIDLSKIKYVHIFLPIKKYKEINTLPIIDYLRAQGKKIVVSKSGLETNDMSHYLLDNNTELEKNKWGILEPKNGEQIPEEKLDLVFIPLLVFDKKGNRIGYGKGYYDKFLAKCSENCIKIGLSHFPPIDFISGMEPMDVSLDYGICPTKLYTF